MRPRTQEDFVLEDGRLASAVMLGRFLDGVQKHGNGCWSCARAYALSNGYAEIKVDRIKSSGLLLRNRVHRISYEHFIGPIQEGLYVLHRCDNRSCCNPAHLFLGTYDDNLKDMAAKDRSAFHERSGQAKLTEKDVKDIYRLYAGGMFQREIGDLYGLTQMAISLIVRGKRWVRLYKKQHGLSTAV
jgi:HNH endonuclease